MQQPLKSKAEVTWEEWPSGLVFQVEWPSGLRHCDGNWKVLVPYYMLSWAQRPNLVNIELQRLSPQEWCKVDCEASKFQIEKKNRFSNKDIVTRGGSQPPLKNSPQLVWNLQLPQKAIRDVKFLELINNHIFHYKCCLCSIVFYI